MIPNNITKDHVLQVLIEIDNHGVPKGRDSRKYKLVYEDKKYPPKYVISLANRYANNEELDPSVFGGGNETNRYLQRLGFEIIDEFHSSVSFPKPIERAKPYSKHNERCPECKQTVENMLTKIYGKVIVNHRFKLGVQPDDFRETSIYESLNTIYSTLQNLRGHEEFTRANNLPNVDFFVPDPGFILEFDESQHFTACRKAALVKYPQSLEVGFDTDKWIQLCKTINARDHDPPYRDEQRAWYDTLRDFLPGIKELQPTIRLFSKDFQWCSLNPEVQSDINTFKRMMGIRRPVKGIEVFEDEKPSLARIVIAGEWGGEVASARKMLQDVCDKWPEDKKVDCLITCGAFLTFKWPETVENVKDNKFPDKSVLDLIISEAQKQCEFLLNEDLRKELMKHTDYITIGIDSKKDKISFSSAQIRNLHVELVSLIDLKTNHYHWTGKSYPTTGQQNGLVRFQDLNSHFIDLPFGKVLILGCHDLNVFSPRGKAVTKEEWRKNVRDEFYDKINKEAPLIVLHHPHTTDSSRIWTASWNELIKTAPSVERYISSGSYYREEGERSPVEEVLDRTKLGETIDFIANIGN